MEKNRSISFIVVYALIIVSMLFMYFFVQANYGSDRNGPYRRRFIDKFFLQKDAESSFRVSSVTF